LFRIAIRFFSTIAVACSPTASSEAQLVAPYAQVGLDLSYRTGYTWRGIPLHGGSSFEPGAFVAHVWRDWSLSAGVWSSMAFASNDESFQTTEIDFWAQYARRLSFLDVSAGWILYDARRDDLLDVFRPERTHEIWIELQWPSQSVTPAVLIWRDIGDVNATYLELETTVRIPIWNLVGVPMGSWTVSAAYANTFGDDRVGGAEEEYYYRSGLEHINLSVATTLGYIPMGRLVAAFAVEGHLVFRLENEARAAWGETDAWLGLTLSLLGPRCRRGQDVCRR
jgi:hypothetical protein